MLDQLVAALRGVSFFELFAALGTAGSIFWGGVKLGRLLSRRSIGIRLDDANARLKREKDRSSELETRFSEIRQVLDGSVDFWLKPAAHDLSRYIKSLNASKPIILVANFKGGVGKTTLSANLAAYFDLHRKKRVLLIDFDYQGSLTETLLASAKLPELEASARRLIQGNDGVETVYDKSHSLHPVLPRSRFFSCFYGFNQVENRLLLEWVTRKEAQEIRFNTHNYLGSELFQKEFDVIIIDAPPRLMTATVNAACASTHVLIPTMLDGMCTNATLNTLGVFHELRKELTPSLNVLGIVPTFIAQRSSLNTRETIALQELTELLPSYWKSAPPPEIFTDAWISRREAIAKVAAQGLAFEADDDVKGMFVALGDKISKKVFVDEGSEPTPSTHEAAANVTRIDAGRRRG